MSDVKMENERLNCNKPSRDYYVHLLVGITETRHCLATLREYVMSVWQDGEISDNWQPSQELLVKLAEEFGLQQCTTQDDTQLVSNCLQSLKHKVNYWDKEIRLQGRRRSDKEVSEGNRNVNCTNNNTVIKSTNGSLEKKTKSVSSQTTTNNDNTLPCLRADDTGSPKHNEDNDRLQKERNDLISQLGSQQDQIKSLLRANQNYKDDYKNKLKSMNRSMALKVEGMNRAMTEAMKKGICSKTSSNKFDELLRRITALNSQLSEKKRELQTLKNVINYNRCNSDHQLKEMQDELDKYKDKSHVNIAVLREDDLKEMEVLQTTLTTLEQENTNLRQLLSFEVSEKLQLLTKYEKPHYRRHSLPGRAENDISLANHMYPLRRQQAIPLI